MTQSELQICSNENVSQGQVEKKIVSAKEIRLEKMLPFKLKEIDDSILETAYVRKDIRKPCGPFSHLFQKQSHNHTKLREQGGYKVQI